MPTTAAQFGFTKLVVADLDKSVAFYRDAFGLTETARIESEIAGRAIEEVLFAPTSTGGATFVLLRYLDVDVPTVGELIVGFLTSDIGTLMAKAVDAGGAVLRDAQVHADLGVTVGFVTDVEGHVIEVVQPT
jgi:lactoylglutathione lyase